MRESIIKEFIRMNNKTSNRSLRIYACGGAGVNLGQLLEKNRTSTSESVANLDITYVDTSRSNMTGQPVPDEHVYLFDGLDGSGKIRRENHQEIAKRIREIVQTHPPHELNIIVQSLAGGTGSVIGPSLVSELLDKKQAVIVLAIGSADTKLDAENTLKSLKSYEAIVEMRQAPVTMVYLQNTKANKREDVNAALVSTVLSLAVLFSGHNRELDTKDLFNFLNFHVPTSFEPQLAHLSLVGPDEHLAAGGHVISVATLVRDGQDSALDPIPEVQFVGYVAADAPQPIVENVPLHFYITDGIFEDANKALNKTLADLVAQQEARVSRGKILSDSDKPTSTGLVL